MNKVFKIEGLDCANCARELEEELNKMDGVSATVDFMGMKVIADFPGAELEKVKYAINHFEDVKIIEDLPEGAVRIFGEKIKVENLCCANCARELEEQLNKIDGVSAVVDFMGSKVVLNCNSAPAREQAIYAITHFEDVKIVSGSARKSPLKEHKKEFICLLVAIALFIPAICLDLTGLMQKEVWIMAVTYTLYGASYLTAGHPVLINTAKNIVKGRIFDENFLMTIASVGAVLLGIFAHEGFYEGVAVMLLYELGELLQAMAVGASRNSISKLMDLKSPTATLIEDGKEQTVSPEDLRSGDVIIIKAGEKVPADCKIISGSTSLDMKSLNGEPVPRDVKEGDEILSGSINLSGVVKAEVIRAYADSAVAKILELVENSSAKKSKPEKFITAFARYYTPLVCIAAILVALAVPTVICAVQSNFLWATYSGWIYKALTFLVISCPCALVISVPLTYFCGIGRCARLGILVKGSTCIDGLALSTVAAFDKTGTITEGTFKIVSYTSEEALNLAAAAERLSSHPLAAAFKDVKTPYAAENAREVAGKGIVCTCNNKSLLCGNASLLKENGVNFTPASGAETLIYVALNGTYVGVIGLDDSLKQGVKEALAALKSSGVSTLAILTGDTRERAEKIAAEAGADRVYSSLLPDEKLTAAEKLKEEGKLIYVGDGINDAPVMTCADCAVSMGKMGSDAAIEASDVVLLTDDISLVPKGRKIAKGTRRIVLQNIVGSLLVKLAVMACGIAVPAFPLIISVVADVGVMLVAVLNAMRASLIK